VENRIRIPAYVVGIIHSLEASMRFDRHLHNGDPLTDVTVHVPAGRPPGTPPFEWIDSAIDALTMHSLDKWTNWSIAGIAYVLERYNGFGYRLHHPHVKSPYLWSFTTIYSSGRYVADGQFSDTAVSRQCGGMALLKRMIELNKVPLSRPTAPADTMDVEPAPKVAVEDGAAAPLTTPPPFPGVLRIDSQGTDVTALQLRLRDLGGAVRDRRAPSDRATTAAGSLAAQVLRIAAGEGGVREVPLGSNRGPRVDQFLNSVGPGLLG
jgi:lysozyme family protein